MREWESERVRESECERVTFEHRHDSGVDLAPGIPFSLKFIISTYCL